MHLFETPTIAELRGDNVAPGTFGRFNFQGHDYWGIVAEYNARQFPVGLWGGPGPAPIFSILGPGVKFLSFGQNVCVEPILGPESNIRNRNLIGTPGSLHVSADKAWFAFEERGGLRDTVYISSSGEIEDTIAQDAFPVARYRIWGSPAHAERVNAVPLFEYPALGPE
ncbi:hypothetical protein LQ948_02690 [Jiella sp. MQZ9-1]|uniref:Uncharacterized protein n=1 Tax=Jiella flava TaxID=2816857 RepID=A0A939FXR5_9HYPH|nr:hypothetical protein [Jiella flava]MBO0661472.1 hypothetical protein [Jiella flava]MCD2470115.1 hypothetical protein [Jiella flava]